MGLGGVRGSRIEAVSAVDDKAPSEISSLELPVGAEFDVAAPVVPTVSHAPDRAYRSGAVSCWNWPDGGFSVTSERRPPTHPPRNTP